MGLRGLGSAMFSTQMWSRIAESLNLSGRELQIVQGVFDDLTEIAIADVIQISPHTVHSHFERLHRKLSVANRVQLVLRIVEQYHRLSA